MFDILAALTPQSRRRQNADMTAAEYRQSLDALPFGKRLPGAVYLIESVDIGNQ